MPSLIKTWNDNIREQMRYGAAAAKDKYMRAVRPVYRVKNGRPDHFGSCFLIELGFNKYLVTAAHVLDDAGDMALQISGHRRTVEITDELWCTPLPEGGTREDDHFDYAWLKLSSELQRKLGGVSYIRETDMSKERVDPDKRSYVLLGYPRSKNKKAKGQKRLRPKMLVNYSLLHPTPMLLQELQLSGDEHLTIGHGDKSIDELGIRKNSIHPRGMSGGPLFDLGRVQDPERWSRQKAFAGVLVGMLIEYYKEYTALLCVRFSVISASIRQKESEVQTSAAPSPR